MLGPADSVMIEAVQRVPVPVVDDKITSLLSCSAAAPAHLTANNRAWHVWSMLQLYYSALQCWHAT